MTRVGTRPVWTAVICALAVASWSVEVSSDAELRIDRLVVHKRERRMDAHDGTTVVRTYRVAIGGGDEGAKLFEGDRRTPEGVYRIDSRHHSAAYHRFLHVAYPSASDRERFRAALRAGAIPPGMRIGRDIGIHGAVRGLSLLAPNVRDSWTDGCIAVTNAEIEELYEAVVDDAVVEIRP